MWLGVAGSGYPISCRICFLLLQNEQYCTVAAACRWRCGCGRGGSCGAAWPSDYVHVDMRSWDDQDHVTAPRDFCERQRMRTRLDPIGSQPGLRPAWILSTLNSNASRAAWIPCARWGGRRGGRRIGRRGGYTCHNLCVSSTDSSLQSPSLSPATQRR